MASLGARPKVLRVVALARVSFDIPSRQSKNQPAAVVLNLGQWADFDALEVAEIANTLAALLAERKIATQTVGYDPDASEVGFSDPSFDPSVQTVRDALLTLKADTAPIESEVVLAIDDQVVEVGGVDVLFLSSDDPVATSRTFLLSGMVRGQILQVIWLGPNVAELIDGTAVEGAGMLRLGGDWIPRRWDTLTVRCAGVALDCYEVARSTNN